MFVPIGKEMDGDAFFERHQSVGLLIYRFFAPITIAASIIPLIIILLSLIRDPTQNALIWVMGVSTLVFFQHIHYILKTPIKN
jgi:hypothetical protein